jgi:hypothetical protein
MVLAVMIVATTATATTKVAGSARAADSAPIRWATRAEQEIASKLAAPTAR